MMPEYTETEKRIMSILYTAGTPLPMERIAKQLKLSRITVKKYLLSLQAQKVVSTEKMGRSVYWWLAVE
jgi:DNA-binding GntR family transcriptional regulator